MVKTLMLLTAFFGFSAFTAPSPDGRNYLLPLTCSELLPDVTPYIGFFEVLGRGNVAHDRKFAKRVFRILALREILAERGVKEQNPIDMLIRKTLCFYREQKEPLKPVPYDDPEFLKFIKASINELENKVDDSVFKSEFERQQRKEYERRALKNQHIAESLMREADIEADGIFNRLSTSAKKKANVQ